MKTVGYASLLGNQISGGTGKWDLENGETHESASSSLSGTRLSEDLGDIHLNSDAKMEDGSQPDDIFQ